ncbi:MAG: DUF1549 domain-containing protein, partial [Verrucomicrobiota bacterium]
HLGANSATGETLRFQADTEQLLGPDARRQLVVMSGETDVTRDVQFKVDPANIAKVDSHGFITPKADGAAAITATFGAQSTKTILTVREFGTPQPISFANDVVPILTRNHCNAGACHAKATGQNGFQLSLLGYDPASDYDFLVRKSRGRRISTAAPETSLLLQKPSGDLPHEGGVRFERGTPDYEMIRRWIESGMTYEPENDPTVERIEVYPKRVVAKPGAQQQLSVTAFFSNGESRDITRLAQFESNQPEMSEADGSGLVSLAEKNGTTSVMVRFQEHMDVFMAMIPHGHQVAELPQPTNFIDEHIFQQLQTLGLPPSRLSDDGAFVRRVTLGIAGRLPTLEETEAFLADKDPNKRAKKIDALLESTDYADFFAGKWAGLLRNKVDRGSEWVARDSYAFHGWIRSSFNANKPFDQFVGELVMASGKAIENPAVSWYRVIKDRKAQMEDMAQVFLGVRMKCAQCHHHPYEKWSQDDYYSFAAFFSTVQRKNTRKLPEEDVVFHNRKPAGMQNPASGETLKPKLLGADEFLQLPVEIDPRRELASWIGATDNPFFAKSVVNRYWKHFMGRGLVEPEDDIRPTNPATHPELFNELAASFTESGYDVKQLIRTICSSQTYQLSSAANEVNGDDEQNYARFYPRRQPAEVLLDSINDLTGAEESFAQMPQGARAISLPNEKGTLQSEFLTMFGRPAMDTACECERSNDANLGQSLHLINSDTIQTKLRTTNGRAMTLAKDKEISDESKIRDLYLRAFAREPDANELGIARSHLEKKRATAAAGAEQEAWEDIIWVMLSTKEFMFTH